MKKIKTSITSICFKLRVDSFVNTMIKLKRKLHSLSRYTMPTGSNTLLSLLGPEKGGSTLSRNVPSGLGIKTPGALNFRQ
jgi:hypothetical protein